MRTNNAMQLKAKVNNRAKAVGISPAHAMQAYVLDCLVVRLSRSRYRDSVIIKGGVLIGSLIGVDKRTTMDLDATVRGFELSHESTRAMFDEVCALESDDDFSFAFVRTEDIRETDDYPGIRVHLRADFPPLSMPDSVDVTTGDRIVPSAITHTFHQFSPSELSLPGTTESSLPRNTSTSRWSSASSATSTTFTCFGGSDETTLRLKSLQMRSKPLQRKGAACRSLQLGERLLPQSSPTIRCSGSGRHTQEGSRMLESSRLVILARQLRRSWRTAIDSLRSKPCSPSCSTGACLVR